MEKGQGMEEAQRAPEGWKPFAARLVAQLPALLWHTRLAGGNLLWQNRINIKFHMSSVNNKQAHYFKYISNALIKKKKSPPCVDLQIISC